MAAKLPPDLVLLDLGLPDLDGVEVILGLRGWTNAPIIVLSGRSGAADKVGALEAGADDYVTKPFGMEELIARMRAVTRRAGTRRAARSTVRLATTGRPGGTHGHRPARQCRPADQDRVGTARAAGPPPRSAGDPAATADQVWGPAFAEESGYLRFHFGQLRRKLEADPARPRHLITEPGIGYRFEA